MAATTRRRVEYEGESPAEPGKEAHKFTGTEKVRSIGGLWFVGEATGKMPDGGDANMLITLGYDPAKKRYVGTWLGSMMTSLWIYEGSVNASGKELVLDCDGPDFSDPTKTAKYQDVIAWVDDNHRILKSRTLNPDGKWHQFMQSKYRRTK